MKLYSIGQTLFAREVDAVAGRLRPERPLPRAVGQVPVALLFEFDATAFWAERRIVPLGDRRLKDPPDTCGVCDAHFGQV